MRKLFAISVAVFALLGGWQSVAEPFVFPKNGILYEMPMPHDQWFEKPLIGPVKITKGEAKFVEDYCSQVTGKFEDIGCAAISTNVCFILINQTLPSRVYDAVLRHETAHCHGWPAEHPTDAPPTSASMDGFISNIERILSKGDRRAFPAP